MPKLCFVIPLTGLDLLASDIETCKHVSASLGSFVIPGACPRLTGMTGNLLFVLLGDARSEADMTNKVVQIL